MKKEIKGARSFARRVGAIAGASVIALTAWVGLGGTIGAAPRVPDAQTCIPTCALDARHLVVAGNDPTTLSAEAITLGLNYTPGEPNVNFEIFDADHLTNWDTPLNAVGDPLHNTPAPELVFSLYADPTQEGSTATLIARWVPGSVAGVPLPADRGPFPISNNSWSGIVPFAQDPAALGLDGNYHNALEVSPFNPTTNGGWNSFKVRANGTVTLLGNQVVGFIGAMNPATDLNIVYPGGFPGASIYDGKWIFNTTLPSFLGDVTVFDGDMDYGNAACTYNDTDDPDSSNAVVPPFAVGSAAAVEGVAVATGGLLCNGVGPGVRTGSPPEDGSPSGAFFRQPTIIPNGIAYQLRSPDNQVFLNQNPSGNKEWEQFKIQKVNHPDDVGAACPAGGYAASPGFTLPDDPNDRLYPASDCRTTTLLGGTWQIELDGMDLANLNFWFFSFKVEPPSTDYSIGRLVWFDANSNGIQDLCAGVPCAPELGIANVAYTVLDGTLTPIRTGVTDANGEFFEGEAGDPLGPLPADDYTVVIDAANFNPGGPLEGLTSTTGGETQNGIEVGLPLCTDTNVPAGCGQPVYAEALFGYNLPSGDGVNAPTTATCQDYISGTIEEENEMRYSKSGNTITNNVPGVIFFFTKVTVGAGQAVTVVQSRTGTGAGILALHGGQARLLTMTCGTVTGWTGTQDPTTGTVSFPAVPPGQYVVQVKWSPKSLVGKPVPVPPTIAYTFQAALNGVPVPASKNDPALSLRPK